MIETFHLGSATDLSTFSANSQDALLCMGPMYHLTEQADRDQAIRECLRTLRPGGLIFIAFISVLGRVFEIVRNYPNRLATELNKIANIVNGPSVATSYEHRFTDAYLLQPAEIEEIMSGYPIERLDLLGVEGLTSQSEPVVTGASDGVTNAWIELAIATASTTAAIHGSDHILYVGRKTS